MVVMRTALQSMVADLTLGLSIGLLLWANTNLFGDHASVAILLVLGSAGAAYLRSPAGRRFKEPEQAINYLRNLQ